VLPAVILCRTEGEYDVLAPRQGENDIRQLEPFGLDSDSCPEEVVAAQDDYRSGTVWRPWTDRGP